jgi:ABC-type nitrate/sulfonate/bicarbonate transport system substrate-binding protein
MGLPPFLKAFSDGLPAQIVGSSIFQQLDHYLVGTPDMNGLQDLKGKRIGILSRGSCDDYFLRVILDRSNIDPKNDVEVLPLGSSYGKLEVFESDRVDAGFLVEPYTALGESRGLVKVLASVKEFFPRYQWGVLFAAKKAIAEKKDLLRRALEAYRLSSHGIRENLDEAAALGAQVFRLKKSIFRRALLRDLDNWEFDIKIDREGMANCIHIQQQLGAIPSGIDAGSIVAENYL